MCHEDAFFLLLNKKNEIEIERSTISKIILIHLWFNESKIKFKQFTDFAKNNNCFRRHLLLCCCYICSWRCYLDSCKCFEIEEYWDGEYWKGSRSFLKKPINSSWHLYRRLLIPCSFFTFPHNSIQKQHHKMFSRYQKHYEINVCNSWTPFIKFSGK